MGWLGDILGGIGDVGKFASPALAFIPGVGPLVAPIAGAASGALGKLNDDEGERSLGSILGAVASGGIAGGLGSLGASASMKGGQSALGGLTMAIKSDPLKAAQLGGAGLSAIQGSRQQAKVNKLIEEELARQKALDEQKMPYQQMLMKRMEEMIGQRPDMASIFAGSQNPFAAPVGGSQVPPNLGSIGGTTPTKPTSYDGRY